MKKMKQILVCLLVAVMLIVPLGVNASETEEVVDGENGVIYVADETNLKFSNYWTTTDKTAPVRPGFVFGGWYTKDGESMNAIKESEGGSITSAYAKFVPAEVMSVRTQIDINTENDNGATERAVVRLLSAVNGLDYQKVGFDIYYNKKHHETDEQATNITKVFRSIQNEESGVEPITARTVFGDAATHFSVLRLEDIAQKNYEYVIYVTPQWTTLDGTLVEGQGKYVRVMDGYAKHHYISVPVNFMTGSKVAAGRLEMEYDSRLEVVDVDSNGYDAGQQKTEGTYYVDEANHKIKFINNITGTANIEPESVVYANVWFRVKTNADTGDVTAWEFDMKDDSFSFANWNEEFVTDLQAWDFKYLKQAF